MEKDMSDTKQANSKTIEALNGLCHEVHIMRAVVRFSFREKVKYLLFRNHVIHLQR